MEDTELPNMNEGEELYVRAGEAALLLGVYRDTLLDWDRPYKFPCDGRLAPNGDRLYLRSRVLSYKAELEQMKKAKVARKNEDYYNEDSQISKSPPSTLTCPEKLTLSDARKFLDISFTKMTMLINQGIIPYETNPLDSRVKLVKRSDLEKLLSKNAASQRYS